MVTVKKISSIFGLVIITGNMVFSSSLVYCYKSKKMNGPYCPGCPTKDLTSVVIHEGQYCQRCREKYDIEYDECVCYTKDPSECKSPSNHECCCGNAFYVDDCRAPKKKHDCICSEGRKYKKKCLALEHDDTKGDSSSSSSDDEA